MPISALPQAPYRQDNKTFPTPLIGDVVFSEIHDCNRGNNPFPEYGTPYPNAAKWPHHKLVYIKPVAIERNEIFEFFYAADRDHQDLYNYSFSQADIGGTKFDSVVRTYVSPRAGFTPTNYAMGAAMSSDPDGIFTDTYVLAEYKQVDAQEQILNSLYVTEQLTYIKKATFTKVDYDQAFGKPLFLTQTLYYKGEIVTGTSTVEELFANQTSSYWGLQSSGVQRSGDQLTDKWYAISEQEVIPASIASVGRTYGTTMNYGWPPVIDYFTTNLFTRNDGKQATYIEPVYRHYEYSGPCKATVFEKFYATPPTVEAPIQMLPLPIDISNPFFGLRVPPSLCAATTVTYSTGTSDPDWDYIVINKAIPATNYTDWPDSIVAQDKLEPARGGYLRTQVTIYKPE
jgi:hypothetical protein